MPPPVLGTPLLIVFLHTAIHDVSAPKTPYVTNPDIYLLLCPQDSTHLDTKRSAAFQELLYVAHTLAVVLGLLENLEREE